MSRSRNAPSSAGEYRVPPPFNIIASNLCRKEPVGKLIPTMLGMFITVLRMATVPLVFLTTCLIKRGLRLR